MRTRRRHVAGLALPRCRPAARRPRAAGTLGTLASIALLLLAMATWVRNPAVAVYSKTTGNPTNTWGAATKFTTCQALMKADGATQLYPFADSTGTTAVDTSGGGYNGTYQGTVTKRQAGPCPADGAFGATFNGSTGYVSTSRLLTNPSLFTIEIWFKTTTTSGGGLISFGNNQTGNPTAWDRQIYMSNTGTLQFGVSCGSQDCYATSTTTYRDGQWHLATGVLSSAGQKLYVDGTLVGTHANTSDTPGYNGYWRYGFAISDGPNQPSSNYVNATLAFGAYFPSALTQAQIQHHYATGN